MQMIERLKLVREALGSSQRKLSLDLGLSPGAWASYESGASLPGTSVLEALGRRAGISLNWLIMGVGGMWQDRPDTESPDADLKGFVDRNEQRLSKELQLGKLSLVAARSHMGDRLAVLRLLTEASPGSLSLAQLLDKFSDHEREEVVLSILDELITEQCVEAIAEGGIERYRVRSSSNYIKSTAKADWDYLALNSIQTVIGDVLPVGIESPDKSVLMNCTVYVDPASGKLLLKKMYEMLQELIPEQTPASDGDVIKVVFAACVANRPSDCRRE